ncbi:MAG: hypothetical protein PHS17_05850 [Desulfobacterales bacterium]|nr:hypothetical protein [Desulfobacterales bacterium]
MDEQKMLAGLSIGLFFLILFSSVKGWITQTLLPLQSVLVIGSLLLFGLALAFQKPFGPLQIMANITFHPITATTAGFLLAGAVEAGGGFAAAGRILSRMGRGFLGLPGTVVLLVNLPTILAMPCGRVWAATLMPAAVMFGFEVARKHHKIDIVPTIVFGLIINAAASCGPSPLGGIGTMGEGTGGFQPQTFSNPQQIAILVVTLVSMAAVAFVTKVPVRAEIAPPPNDVGKRLPLTAYLTFALYVVVLGVVFLTRPSVPIQTILLALTIAIMIMGRVSLKELIAGVILHPITVMVAGFIMGGALLVTGGFDAMIHLLSWIALHTPLGFIGVSVFLIYVPIIFPMPCGRIIAAALLPGVFLFGAEVARVTGHPQVLPAMLIGFILSCAASCGPSPLGGIGSIGEGNLGVRHGSAGLPMQFGIFAGVPVAALIVSVMGLSQDLFRTNEILLSLGLGLVSGLVVNVVLGFKSYNPGGLVGGLLVGGLIILL